MQNYSVISKGAYVRPQTENFVSVTSFLFVRQEGKKFLLLKLKNPRGEAVGEINIKVTLLDKKGQTISVLHLSSDKGGAANSSFAFGEKTEVDEACCDFTAKVESAVYGGYLYRDGKGGVALDYAAAEQSGFDPEKVKASMHGKTRAVTERRLGVPVAVSILALLLLVCTALVTYFQLKSFMDNATGFTYSGVDYVFVDPDKTRGSDIIVTGYRGAKSNVVIPEKIDGYIVSEIRGSAFEGNTKIKNLKIEGEVKIGEYAFADCARLSSVTMDKTVEVGEYAFSGCKSLKTLEITGGGEVLLGGYAFKDCTALESVKIQKQIIYPANAALFIGANSLKDLYLQNFVSEGGGISKLFGGYALSSLTNVTIVSLDAVSDNFCSLFPNLESVTIESIEGEGYRIGNSAFRGTSLKTLKIPQGLISVGDYAFAGTQITSFISYNVESIGAYAFNDCTQLKKFAVPESLTTLSRGAFSGCAALESVTFESEKNLVEIGDFAFYGCESLESIAIPDSVALMGAQIFGGCENLVSLTLPYVGSIAKESSMLSYLFGQTANLKSITLTSAIDVAASAFDGWKSLEEINLNEGIGYIGSGAFQGCTGLKSIVIPSTVSDTGGWIFSNCYRLFEIYNLSGVEITCNYALAVYTSIDQSMPKASADGYTAAYTDGAFAQPEGWYLIDYPDGQTLILPDGFGGVPSYKITDYLFYEENDISSVSIPKAVAGLGAAAFYGCLSLAEISIDRFSEIGEIKDSAFYDCLSLASIVLPNVNSIGDNAFCGCAALESVGLYSDITEIGNYAFYDCRSLKEVWISGRSVSLGDHSFSGCNSLTKVSLTGFSSIGEWAFFGDVALEIVEMTYADGNIGAYAFAYCTSLSEIVLPEGTAKINKLAFSSCTNLRKITLPKSLTGIDTGAFKDCPRLRAVVNYSPLNISADDNYGGVGKLAVYIATRATDAAMLFYIEDGGITFLRYYGDWVAVWCDDGVTEINIPSTNGYSMFSIASYAFAENTSIKSAYLRGISSIGEKAFYSCSALTDVVLGSNLTEIGDYAFAYCLNLNNLNLQETSLGHLGEGAFFDCMSLTGVSLPQTLTQISPLAFSYCLALGDVVIPRSLTYIGNEAFYGCTALLQVHNLSGINLRTGRVDNGYCAYYALYVFTDAVGKMTFAEEDGNKFANYNQSWYLYAGRTYILPETFTYENSTITSYKIRAGAFDPSTRSLVIPTAVTEIESGALNTSVTVYYCGTQSQWQSIRPADMVNAKVYYYSPCIHSDDENLWTYHSNYPGTSQTILDWTVTKQATCEEDGEKTGVCPVCGFTRKEVIEKLYHSYNEDGKCTKCGKEGEFLQSANGSYERYTVSSSSFTEESGTFVSTNSNGGTYATLTVTAKENMQVLFACRTSSYYDTLTVTAGGEAIGDLSSYSLTHYKIELLKGQTLTFSFYKNPYYNASGGAVISYILIYV